MHPGKEVAAIITPEEIKSLLDTDQASESKRKARQGQRYYDGEHDIKDYRIFYFDDEGVLREDKMRSNIKISHCFFTELVDQEVQYFLSGKEGFAFSDQPELQEELDAYFNNNEDFRAELSDAVTGAIVKGWDYLYAYRNSEGRLAFQCADALDVTEAEGRYTSDGRDYVIYSYVQRIDLKGKTVRKIEVWDDKCVTFFVQHDSGLPELDTAEKVNPRPHVLYRKENDDSTYYEGLGFIPFFRLDNNRRRISGLKPVKALIDDYDLMACGLSNNLQDLTEGIYAVRGFQGSSFDELQQNLKTKKIVGVDEDGDVEIRTISIPYEARKVKLELDEKNIYRFGMGFNAAEVGDGNITNVVIRSRYALLDLKCNKLEARVKQFLRKIVGVVLEEINKEQGTSYQSSDVHFRFEREIMTNAADNAQIGLTEAQTRQTQVNTLLSLLTQAPSEQVWKDLCSVLDWDYAEIRDKLPDDPAADAQRALTALENTQEDADE